MTWHTYTHTPPTHHSLTPTIVTTKYQLPTPYGLRDTAWTNFSRHPLAHPEAMCENNALKGCGVKLKILIT